MNVFEGKISIRWNESRNVAARFNEFIVSKQWQEHRMHFVRHDVKEEDIDPAWVPEYRNLLIASKMAKSGKYDAVIALEQLSVVQQHTMIMYAAKYRKELQRVSQFRISRLVFGRDHNENIEQAIERAGTKAGNKGYD